MSSQSDHLLMKSINFEFLREQWPELAGLGGFAETYAHRDHGASLGKLRTFCEQAAKSIHERLRLPRQVRPELFNLLDDDSFKAAVPGVVQNKMHTLRKAGNKAVHEGDGDRSLALRLLKDAYDIGRWLFVNFAGGRAEDCPEFIEPPAGGAEGFQRRREKRAILERVSQQEAQMQQLLEQLEETRKRADREAATRAELETALAAGQQAAAAIEAVDPHSFNEAETRRQLIDMQLVEAGWNVGEGLTNTDEVLKEVQLVGQPTPSGRGAADYVLVDDNGKPLAVIEAKRTSISEEAGRTQATLYANALQAEHGQRPLIYYTNGYETKLWNDAEGEPPRKVYGFYSKDSLQHLHFQRGEKLPQSEVTPNTKIAGRLYQIESVRRVIEEFAKKRRNALVVQATGTGKTRVAISLCDALVKAKWAKRVLFLCDRRELRKQADNAFKEHLPAEPRTFVTAQTSKDRDKHIYLATYPAMVKCFESFDVGFFDLIIADESHRSLYNRYRQIFEYFDACQVGLTATPVNYVSRNTFKLFGCEDQDPTFNYPYEEAIAGPEPYLVPFRVETHTTEFLRSGIKYSQMSKEQQEQLEEDEELPAEIEYEQAEVDKHIFNKDTNRKILRNLMERGIRNADGTHVGKTIVFARSHDHAVLLQNLFDELYPQYGGKLCRVIDSHDKRAEELIDDFKGVGQHPELTIAISVDMLDTGIDVPEIVNLVFAKPVWSYVKFWQMIGRGTRLCKDLFGPGNDKTHFRIFDHWGNFERFGEGYETPEPTRTKSLKERVFEARMELADAALDKQHSDAFELAIELLGADLNALPTNTIAVREKRQQLHAVASKETLHQWHAGTKATLRSEIAPLMEWINLSGAEEANKFDQLIAQLQAALIRGSSRFDDLKDDVVNRVSALPVNLSQVKVKKDTIERVTSSEFWDEVTVRDLETIRIELRGIQKFRPKIGPPKQPAKVIDIAEDDALVERGQPSQSVEGLDMAVYRSRVIKVLTDIIDANPVLKKIKAGEPVDEAELESLVSLVLTQEPDIDLHHLEDYYPEFAGHLDLAIRSIVGMDARVVHERFTEFVHQHPNLASHQIKFLDLLQKHIARYGSIDVDSLYEAPFTTIHSESLDGLFEGPTAEELDSIIRSFQPQGRERGKA
jgi:type I restriction enzyme, R subunit